MDDKLYTRNCYFCKKEFHTPSRTQRFCAEECRKANSSRVKRRRSSSRKASRANPLKFRMKSAAHRLTALVVEFAGIPAICKRCGSTIKLERHHKNTYLDCRPESIEILCYKCHKAESASQYGKERSTHENAYEVVIPKKLEKLTKQELLELVRKILDHSKTTDAIGENAA